MTPFANPLIQPVPHAVAIANIANSNPCVVQTATPHGYKNLIIVSIVIPYPNVMPQFSGKTYVAFVFNPTILVLFTNGTFLPVDSTKYGAFAAAPNVRVVELDPPYPPIITFIPGQQAQVVPTGEFSTTLLNVSDIIGPNNPPVPLT